MKAAIGIEALTPAILISAIESIVSVCQPSRILVFGSRARGERRIDSDLDLLVLLSAPVDDIVPLRCRLRSLLANLPVAKDILVSDPEHFASWRLQLNSVYRSAAEEGVAIWHDGRVDRTVAEQVCR